MSSSSRSRRDEDYEDHRSKSRHSDSSSRYEKSSSRGDRERIRSRSPSNHYRDRDHHRDRRERDRDFEKIEKSSRDYPAAAASGQKDTYSSSSREHRRKSRSKSPPAPVQKRRKSRSTSRDRDRDRHEPVEEEADTDQVTRIKRRPRERSIPPRSAESPPRIESKDRKPGREQDWGNFFQNIDIKKEKFVNEEKDVGQFEYGKRAGDGDGKGPPPKDKEKPNFGLSGKLTEETNTFRGVVIKYSEPPEARKPQRIRWRFYQFKGTESLETLHIHRQSAYLLGRDRKIADIPIDHPSCSKQHAVLQYRLVPHERPDGSLTRRIKPYIIDLESANGTFINGKQIEPKRFHELFEKDILKFGFSTREYVLLHDQSKNQEASDTPDSQKSASVSPEPLSTATGGKLKIKQEPID